MVGPVVTFLFGDVLCTRLVSSTRTSNCDDTATKRPDGGYLRSYPLTSPCDTGYSNSSDCGYCRKTRSGQSDVKRESLLDPIHMSEGASQALGDSHDAYKAPCTSAITLNETVFLARLKMPFHTHATLCQRRTLF